MDEENQSVTIQSYNHYVKEYINKDSNDDIRTLAYWPGVKYFLEKLNNGQTIFEIGSGTGSDALRLEKCGFAVKRTDIADGFLEYLRSQGFEAEYYNVLNGPPELSSAIFANAVLLHLNTGQFKKALKNIHQGLKPKGYFCICMKLGDFEGWREKGLSGKRYFKFWNLPDLKSHVIEAGFEIKDTFVVPDGGLVVITAQKL